MEFKKEKEEKKNEIQIRTHLLADNTLKSSQTQKLQYNILESTQEGGESCDTEKIR